MFLFKINESFTFYTTKSEDFTMKRFVLLGYQNLTNRVDMQIILEGMEIYRPTMKNKLVLYCSIKNHMHGVCINNKISHKYFPSSYTYNYSSKKIETYIS